LHFQFVSPTDLLRRVASAYQHQAEQQQVNLVVDVEPSLPEARLDPERMEQVLGNLVSNALRYTPEGGEVRLIARQADGLLMLEVQDTGSGIAADVLPHIFERSYRGDPSRSGDESGLGLAIAKSIVELHGGSIRVESESGSGSVFIFTLSLV
jgi:signal transduction histidine kinase